MGTLNNHHGSRLIKALIMGDSGTGKTGSLESLVRAGFRLHILDLDNGLDILASRFPENSPLLTTIEYETVVNDRQWDKEGKLKKSAKPEAWGLSMKILTEWANRENLNDQDVIVVDSLTRMGKNALDFVLYTNSRLGENPTQPEWGSGQRLLEGAIQLLFSEEIKCHVLVMTHVRVQQLDTGKVKWMPSSLGQALNEIIPTYINNMIFYVTKKDSRYLTTQPSGFVDVKVSNPNRVKAEYLISEGIIGKPGLAEFFRDMGAKWPTEYSNS